MGVVVLKIDRLLIYYLAGVDSFHSIWAWLWSCWFSSVWWWWCVVPTWAPATGFQPWNPFSARLFFPSCLPHACPFGHSFAWRETSCITRRMLGRCCHLLWMERKNWKAAQKAPDLERIYYLLGTTCDEYTWTFDTEEELGRFWAIHSFEYLIVYNVIPPVLPFLFRKTSNFPFFSGENGWILNLVPLNPRRARILWYLSQ